MALPTSPKTTTVAIVGLACRFPGPCTGVPAFWAALAAKVDCLREVPLQRWDVDQWWDPEPAVRGKMYVREAGFLEGAEEFDPSFFAIGPAAQAAACLPIIFVACGGGGNTRLPPATCLEGQCV